MKLSALALIVGLLALSGCAHAPRPNGLNPSDEFFCDDTPELDPQRCGLEPGEGGTA